MAMVILSSVFIASTAAAEQVTFTCYGRSLPTITIGPVDIPTGAISAELLAIAKAQSNAKTWALLGSNPNFICST
ncbi:MAG: hypothetical protein H7240_05820 [Glaciimonas sp.]|nr:hypothetical protein [Glaciimonas sp.]